MFLWHQEQQEWSIYSAFLARLVPVAVSRTKQTLTKRAPVCVLNFAPLR